MKGILRRTIKRTTALCLAAALICSVGIGAAASEAMGSELSGEEILIHQETQLSTNVFWSSSSSDRRTEHLVTYQPNGKVKPIVTYGDSMTSRNTISYTARLLEGQGYRVVAGINGDFYDMSNGIPLGIVVTDGELRSSDGGFYAVGFHADGTAILGRPAMKISADLGYQMPNSAGQMEPVFTSIAGVNKARVSTGGVFLYTHEFNRHHTTGNTEPGVDVVCTILEGKLAIGGEMKLRVDQVLTAQSATAVGPGQVVLSVNLKADEYHVNALRNLPLGTEIHLTAQAADAAWNHVDYAIGALFSLVENGQIAPGLDRSVHPRTAVGQKADGTLVFYTIDGRQKGYSIGATLRQVAARLIELGCVRALGLDGGGSTTLTVTKPDAWNAKTVNSPSGGAERGVSNQIFLVADNTPTERFHHYYMKPEQEYVLAGSRVKIQVTALDTNFLPMKKEHVLKSSAGTMEGDILTTPAAGGDVTITAQNGGTDTREIVVHAISTPDSLAIRDSKGTAVQSLTVKPGSQVSLVPSAVYRGVALKADPEVFHWTVNGTMGTITPNGTFTAAEPGTGSITVSAGSQSVTIPVTVPAPQVILPLSTVEEFEDSSTVLDGSGSGITLSLNRTADQVRMGRGSGELTYQLLEENGGQARWTLESPVGIDGKYTGLSLWVYGDGSGNLLELLASDGTQETAVLQETLNFRGWKQLRTRHWKEGDTLTGLRISCPQGSPVLQGTIYLDQIVTTSGGALDHEVPNVTLTAAGQTATATIRDAVDGFLPRERIDVSVDGVKRGFSYEETSGVLTLPIPGDGLAHRITVTARDASGNIGRASLDRPATGETGYHFTDLHDYWGARYVDFLYTANITTGYQDGSFRPNQNITRAQFTVMLFRYLGLEEEQYASDPLPFADAETIPAYARSAVRALYAEGIVNGTRGADGALRFHPDQSLTRAQAAAMIGRTQEKGYAMSAGTFTDRQAIPGYALSYIQTMTAQGVISGYQDGSFRPQANITRGQMAKILYQLL